MIKPFVTIELDLALTERDRRRIGWAPPELSGFERYRTIAFDADVMRQMIYFDSTRGAVELGSWIDGVVPECYRSAVRALVPEAWEPFRGQKWRGEETLQLLIRELRVEIWGRIEPIMPGEDPR